MAKTAIMCLCDKDYVFALGAFLINLKKTSLNEYIDAIVVYHDAIDNGVISDICNLDKRLFFIKYSVENFYEEFGLVSGCESSSVNNFIMRYSHLCYVKLKALQLLQDFEKVIFLDLDIILYESDKWKSILSIKSDFLWRNGDNFKKKFGQLDNKPVCDIEISEALPTPNGGFFIVNKSFDNYMAYKTGVDFLRRYMPYKQAGIDELALAYIVKKHSLKLSNLDISVYNTFPHLVSKKTLLCHFMGKRKPWNDQLMQAVFPVWIDNYEEFIGLTKQNPSSLVKIFPQAPGNIVKKELIRDRWGSFFSESGLKLPRILHFCSCFDEPWLAFQLNSSLYYEIKFNIYSDEYYTFGVWIYEPKILSKKIINFLLSNLKASLKLRRELNEKDLRMAYISLSPFKVSQSKSKFNIIWRETTYLRLFYLLDSFFYCSRKYILRKFKFTQK